MFNIRSLFYYKVCVNEQITESYYEIKISMASFNIYHNI